MECKNLSKYYPIAMKFSEFLFLSEDTYAIDFGPDLSIRLRNPLIFQGSIFNFLIKPSVVKSSRATSERGKTHLT